jgi:hypothetical protein
LGAITAQAAPNEGAVMDVALVLCALLAADTDELAGVSPARLIPRLELQHRFTQTEGGAHVHQTIFRMDVRLVSRTLIRYELPLVVRETPAGTRSGFGDVQVQAITLLSSGPRHAAVATGGLALDSASGPELGTGHHRAIYGAALGVRPTAWWLTYLLAAHQVSFGGDSARPEVNLLSLEIGNAVFGETGDWYLLGLTPVFDLDGGDTRLFAALEAGRFLIGRLGLFVRGGAQPLGPRQLDHTVDAGLRYLFRLPP